MIDAQLQSVGRRVVESRETYEGNAGSDYTSMLESCKKINRGTVRQLGTSYGRISFPSSMPLSSLTLAEQQH